MEQKPPCLGILAALGTRIYNLLYAIGIWLAYGAVRRIPIRAE